MGGPPRFTRQHGARLCVNSSIRDLAFVVCKRRSPTRQAAAPIASRPPGMIISRAAFRGDWPMKLTLTASAALALRMSSLPGMAIQTVPLPQHTDGTHDVQNPDGQMQDKDSTDQRD